MSWWLRGYLAGYAAYFAYKIVRSYLWSTLFADHWAAITVGHAITGTLWPILVPLELIGVRAPLLFLFGGLR